MVSKFYSNAKINLALSINYQRPDSYHDISSIMQEINLYDIIEISKDNSNVINITSKGLKVPEDKSNLCYIAAKLFLEYYNIDSGINITINKTIPIGAGLGGGSSNAATVIKGLSQLFDIPITKDIFYDCIAVACIAVRIKGLSAIDSIWRAVELSAYNPARHFSQSPLRTIRLRR